MKTSKTIQPNRRKFLLAAGAGTATVAAAVAVKTATPLKQADAAPGTPNATGYQASEHVLKYYKTTEV